LTASSKRGVTVSHGTRADEARWKKWGDHLERIVQETYRTHHYRQLYRSLAEITQAANLPTSSIFDAFGVWYVTTQTSSVRRQLDRTKRTVSLRRLLDDIAQNPHVASRERHVALWVANTPQPIIDEAHANFDRFAGARDRDRIDAALVRADLHQLKAVGDVVERYANEAVAHTSIEETRTMLTYSELNAAIDEIGGLVKKYASLLKATILLQLEPVIQHDWKAPFRQAWIPAEGHD
jgi:hypothetical protein